MSTRRRRTHGDPRKLGGRIAGPGGPRERGAVIIDSTDAVLLDAVAVATVDTFSGGESAGEVFAIQLSGRINRTTDHAEVLYLADEDGIASLVSELLACATRAGRSEHVMRLLNERMVALHAADAIRPVKPEESNG